MSRNAEFAPRASHLRIGLALATVFVSAAPLIPSPARAQSAEQSATYVSQIDEDLTIRKITVLPVLDNVDGIYARPLESQLVNLVRSSHRWDFVEAGIAGSLPTITELEESPTEVQRATRTLDADAFIASAISRGPAGLSIRLDLFLKKDGKLLVQEILRDHQRSELGEVRELMNILYKKMMAKLPYDGLLLSRQANRVTINLGRSDGLVKDQTVTAVQIISATRHPKFGFLISTDKEILGRIKILKVDETLSFGAIVSEKERGAIRKLAKISGLDPVNYPAPENLDSRSGAAGLSDRPDSAVTFGKEPREWLPVRAPTFGQVGVTLGVGTYASSVSLSTIGSLEAKSTFYPSLNLNGELWINPEYTVRAELSQGVISTSNPRANSSPGNLSHAMSRYSLGVGYNFLLRDDFFGPKLQLNGGFSSYRMFVDDSNPQALTSATFSGFYIGLSGTFPVTDDRVWYAGGRLNFYPIPALSETPTSSGGSPRVTMTEFSLIGEKKIAENMRITASLEFSLYGANFSGSGTRRDGESATSLSHRHTAFTGGISYMF